MPPTLRLLPPSARPLWQTLSLTLLLTLLVSLASGVAPARAGDADSPLEVRLLSACTDNAGMDLLHVGVGVDQATGATFQVNNLPVGSEIVHAWLYWNGTDDGDDASNDDPATFNPLIHDGDPTVMLDGIQVGAVERIGGPAGWIMPGVPARNDLFAYAYRAEVSAIVTGNGDYVMSGMDNFDTYNNGAELVILYRQEALPLQYVAVAEGLDLAFGYNGPTSGPGTRPAIFYFEPSFGKRSADVHVFLGGAGVSGETAFWYRTGSQPIANPNTFNLVPPPGSTPEPGVLKIDDTFDGFNNQNNTGYWDSYQVEIAIPAGAAWLAIQAESKNTLPLVERAALDWVGATVQMPLVCPYKLYTPLLLR